MAKDLTVDLAVVGAGPGGYVAAIRGAQLGLEVACVERDQVGGTCLNYGCIPSKALLDSTHLLMEIRGADEHGIKTGKVEVDFERLMARKREVVQKFVKGVEFLFKKNKVTLVRGQARFDGKNALKVGGGNGNTTTVQAKQIIVATGSAPVELPFMPFDGMRIVSSKEALELESIPKSMLVVGGGYIGLEMGSVFNRLGTEVTVVEMEDRLLLGMDGDLAKEALKILKKQGLEFRLKTRVTGAEVQKNGVKATVETPGGEEEILNAHVVLVAVGRRPYFEELGLDGLGVELKDRQIKVDNQLRTGVDGVLAIGDAVGGALLAHKASEEGIVAAEVAAGRNAEMEYFAVPACIYTYPEIACVGLTEEEARERGHELKTGRFPFQANSRAMCLGEGDGFVKFLADAETDQLLGVHCIGPHASDLIHEATVALAFGGTAEDVALTVHAHPTLSEAFHEAALDVGGRAIHI